MLLSTLATLEYGIRRAQYTHRDGYLGELRSGGPGPARRSSNSACTEFKEVPLATPSLSRYPASEVHPAYPDVE